MTVEIMYNHLEQGLLCANFSRCSISEIKFKIEEHCVEVLGDLCYLIFGKSRDLPSLEL